jgi:hypothetical protein
MATYKEITSQIEELEQLAEETRIRERYECIAQIQAMMREHDINVGDLLGNEPPKDWKKVMSVLWGGITQDAQFRPFKDRSVKKKISRRKKG